MIRTWWHCLCGMFRGCRMSWVRMGFRAKKKYFCECGYRKELLNPEEREFVRWVKGVRQ